MFHPGKSCGKQKIVFLGAECNFASLECGGKNGMKNFE
jgi:hypothetical protein